MSCTNRNKLVMLLGVLGVSGVGCDTGGSASDPPSWEDFRDAAVRVADGEVRYVVDGDIAVTLEQLEQAHVDVVASMQGDEPRSIVNTVNGTIDRWTASKEKNLTYCVSNAFSTRKARAVQEMSAAARSWELAAAVDFKYVPTEDGNCTASNNKVVFAVRPWDQGGARAFFPSSPAASRTLYMDYDDIDTGPDWDTLAPRLTTIGVFRHELGHALGLRHEHTRPQTSMCYEDSAWKELGAYDKRSVMHYPWCGGISTADLTLTVADEQGARTLYGPPVVVRADPQLPVDFNGDGRADLGLTGSSAWTTLPVALSTGDGFTVFNKTVGAFAGYAGQAGVMAATGDFNGDGKTDVALTGPASWTTLPVAMSDGAGAFSVTNAPIASFADYAERDDARLLTGDFNGDDRTDLALLGPDAWSTLPVAMSNGNGTFKVSNSPVGDFAKWAALDNVRMVTGDFNADGRTDVALTGAAAWASIPVALSKGDGSFTVTNKSVASFPGFAAAAGAVVIPGDFNGDGRMDLALTGPGAWTTIPVAFSTGDGGFTVTNTANSTFANWSELLGVRVLPGDFNGDGRTDLALTGPASWSSLPVALSNGDGTFTNVNASIGSFADYAEVGSRPAVADFNGDGRSDIALTGPSAWITIPVAYSTGTGSFTVKNHTAGSFAGFASHEGVATLQ